MLSRDGDVADTDVRWWKHVLHLLPLCRRCMQMPGNSSCNCKEGNEGRCRLRPSAVAETGFVL